MIPGTQHTSLSSRILHADTFALMVSPAIADLQFEAPEASRMCLLRSYAGVWRAFVGALSHDLVCDLSA
ncbi:MAG: hypothetical protein ACRD1T_26215, partial [Acidimicrobiia bacterium]